MLRRTDICTSFSGTIRTYFNHTTITTELRNFPPIRNDVIKTTTRPSFLRACRCRPSEEDTINSRQLIEQKWETLPRLIIPQRMITFLPPTRLSFFTLRNSIYRKIKKCTIRLLLHEILSDHADNVRLPFLLLLLLIGYLDFCQSFPWLRDHLLSRKKNLFTQPYFRRCCSENANNILRDVARESFFLQIFESFSE